MRCSPERQDTPMHLPRWPYRLTGRILRLPGVFLAALLAGLLAGVVEARARTPRVHSVEPPNWWVGHSLNPVRLLVRGTNLIGARVTSSLPTCRPGLARVNPAGTYLLVDLDIDRNAPVGPIQLTLSGANELETEVSFELLEPLPRTGRFQGLTSEDILYLVIPDRFANADPSNDEPAKALNLTDRTKARHYHGGDLRGLQDRLPYLKELGVTAIWLTPWYDNADHLNQLQRFGPDQQPSPTGEPVADYHGYHPVDFYSVEEHLGTLKALSELVDAAHAAGLKVIQDQVANNISPYHPWLLDSPTPRWFNGTRTDHLIADSRTWLLTDPYSPRSLQRPILEGWFANLLPDLNQNDDDCARYLIQNSLWWVGMTGLDAIRQDSLPYVPRSYWASWTGALKREFPELHVIGDVPDMEASRVSFFQGGQVRFDGIDSGVDMLFDFPLANAVRKAFVEGQPLRVLPEQLSRDHLYPDPRGLVTLLGWHDSTRFLHERGATPQGLRLAFTFLLTTRGIPLIYYGDEIAMRGGKDPDNRRDFPGGWLEDPRNAFTLAGRTPEQQSMFEYVSGLTRLRRENVALRRGRLVHLAVEEQAYVYARISPQQRFVVAINNHKQPQLVSFRTSPLGRTARCHLAPRLGDAPPVQLNGEDLTLSIPAMSALVWEVKENLGTNPSVQPAPLTMETASPVIQTNQAATQTEPLP